MNKYLAFGIAAVFLIVGGWWYFNQSRISSEAQLPFLQENASTENQIPAEPSTSTSTIRENVKVGDKIEGLTVTDIKVIALPSGDPKKDLRISFSGETVVRGTWGVGGESGPDEVSIRVYKTDNPQFPYFLLDPQSQVVTINFTNPTVARQALTAYSAEVSVKIRDFSAAWATGTMAVSLAEFVTLAQ